MQKRNPFQDSLLILGLACVTGFGAVLTVLTWRHGAAHFGPGATSLMFVPVPLPPAWVAMPIHAARVAGDFGPLLCVLGIGCGFSFLAMVTNDVRAESLLRLVRPAAADDAALISGAVERSATTTTDDSERRGPPRRGWDMK